MADLLRCPRDGTTAQTERHKGRFGHFEVDVCPTCGGVWFDKGEIADLCRDKEIERMIVEYASGDSRIECPRCGAEMASRPMSEVTLDVCPKCHGVWFDRGELEAAARVLADEEIQRGVAEEFGFDIAGGLHARDLIVLSFYSPNLHRTLLEETGTRADRLGQL